MSRLEELIAELCPDGVEYKPLNALGKFYGGLTGKSKNDFTNGNATFISYRNVYSNPALDTNPSDTVKIADGENQRTLAYGDVVFTGSSETPDECGFSSVVTQYPTKPLYLNSFCFFFRFDDLSSIEPDFMKHLFRSSNLRYQIGKTASGVTRFNVSKEKMGKVSIPLPPLSVQREIVKILDSFTELTAELTAGLTAELTARQKQYEYYHRVLLSFDTNIEHLPLRELVAFRNGKGHEKDIVENGKYIVVNSKFISTNGQTKKYTSKQICPLYIDDILMVMSDLPNGKALAKCFHVKENNVFSLNQRIGAFHVISKSVTTRFLFHILNRNPQLLRYDNGADQTNLRKDEILDILIPIPSIDTQNSIISLLDSFDSLCTKMRIGLPAEIAARQKQYEYYRDKLLNFRNETE